MIKLNLLPPEEKKEIAGQKDFRKVLARGSFSLALVLVFLAILASIWLYLLIQLRSVQEIASELEANPQNQTFQDIKKEIDGINKKMQAFDKLESQRKEYSFYLQKLSELVNPGIVFRSVNFVGSKVSLSGQASTREVLLSLKSALESSPYFQNINAPLSNFLKQNNIGFSFSFELKSQ
jgi:Tfp pilus assembly protein PilN